ncbi:hypothetical protein [Phocaeicola coprocola]|uniref:hypothetical protein n=1 Tax=Phocaeicola coprocola TaxID=310298 RepID=UPI004025EBFF
MRYVIPILSLIISVIALAVALPRPNNLGFDYLGVIVAIISLATAFAVGFQIWNALSLEKRLQKLESKIEAENIAKIDTLEEKLTNDFNNKIKELDTWSSYKIDLVTGTIALNSNRFNDAFSMFVDALRFETVLLKEFNKDMGDVLVFSISSLIDGGFGIKITDSNQQKYIIETIIDSGKEELIEKIGIIKSKIFQSEASV